MPLTTFSCRPCQRLCCAIACLGMAWMTPPTWADDDFIVYSPHVVQGQSEVELRGYSVADGRPGINGAGAFEVAVAHTFTNWWKMEYYAGEFTRDPVLGTQFAGQELENIFQLAEAGEYWVDPGFVVSYIHNHQPGLANGVEFGPLLEKQSGPLLQRLNMIWQKDLGGMYNDRYNFRAAYSLGYRIHATVVPGLEAYYRPADNAHQVGPAFSGEWALGRGDEVEYSTALVFGVNHGAPDSTFIMRVAYEFF